MSQVKGGCGSCKQKSRKEVRYESSSSSSSSSSEDYQVIKKKVKGCNGCGNPCKSPKRDKCVENLNCTPQPKVGTYRIPASKDCSAKHLNDTIDKIHKSCYDEAVIHLPPGYTIGEGEKVCLNSTKKISICGDPCSPALFLGDVVSCGSKSFHAINLSGNGIYQVNPTCNTCLDPDHFDEIEVSCNRSFVSEGDGFRFTNSEFNIDQNKKFVIYMKSGTLTLDDNTVNITPRGEAVAFAYYNSGGTHKHSENQFCLGDPKNKCEPYAIHMLDSCTSLTSYNNQYTSGCTGSFTVFLGDKNPNAQVLSVGDLAKETSSEGKITFVDDLPWSVIISGANLFVSKILNLPTVGARKNCKGETETEPGTFKMSLSLYMNPFAVKNPAISVTSDVDYGINSNGFKLELNNSELNAFTEPSPIVLSGTQSMTVVTALSTFLNRNGDNTTEVLTGTIPEPVLQTVQSTLIDYLQPTNVGGILNLGSVSPF